ncbi:MAG TPA: hypothetical protein VMV10_16105 [Pirellulales bacterium]|nr:hypothetical protein [Pirellulales bacterium]
MKLLIVAEATTSASALEQCLTEHGYAVVTAHATEEAIAAIGAHADIEIVLSDEALLRSKVGTQLAAYVEIDGSSEAPSSRFILWSAQTFVEGDGQAAPDGDAIRQTLDTNELLRRLSLLMRPQRFDAAHRQLRDYVDQRPRRLVKVDEVQFNAFAAAP